MNKQNLNIYLALLILLLCFHVVNNYLWLKDNNSIKGQDVQNHLFYSIEFFYDMSGIISSSTTSICTKLFDLMNLLNRPVKHSMIYWPNFVNLISSIFYFIFGKSLLAAKLTMLSFLFILLISTYSIGKDISTRSVGLFSAFLVSMYPMVFESSRQFSLDFPLTAMVALTILFLLRCNNFRSTKYSIFLGISFGIAMLTKGQAILFIFGPLILILIYTAKDIKKIVKEKTEKEKTLYDQKVIIRVILNILLFIVLAVLISSIWWGNKISEALIKISEHIKNPLNIFESYSRTEKYSLSASLYHFKAIGIVSIGIFFFGIFLFSFLLLLKQRNIKHKGMLLCWLLIPFLIFSIVITVKHDRYLMPTLPIIAIISAWGVKQIKNATFRNIIVCLIVIFGLIQFCLLFYDVPHYRKICIGQIKIFGGSRYGDVIHREDLEIKEILKIINENKLKERSVKIGYILCTANRMPDTLEMLYWLKLEDRSFDPMDLGEMHEYFLENFDSLDFILFCPPANSNLIWPKGEEFIKEFKRFNFGKYKDLEHHRDWFELLGKLGNSYAEFKLIKKIERDDGFTCYIYKRR